MNSEIMTSREVYIVMAWWFVHQSLPYIQAQPNNASPVNRKLNFTTSDQLPQNYEVAHHDGKAVLSEEQNQHCFKTYILGSGESNGELIVRYCYPGYRRSRENETCSGPHGCCHCAQGTYMPRPNDCSQCIMKTFCHDYGLEYKDFGSSTNNSKCGTKIQKHTNDQTSPPNTLEAADPTCIATAAASTYTTKESEKAGISDIELWMDEQVLAIKLCAAFSFIGVVAVVLIGPFCLVYFCILRVKKDKRNFVSSRDELKMAERKSSKADKLTDDAGEEEAFEV